MQKNHYERKIMETIEEYGETGIGFRQLCEKAGVGNTRTRKILTNLAKHDEIYYPSTKRGKRTKIRKKFPDMSFLFPKLKKKEWKDEDVMENMINKIVMITDKDGRDFAGRLDDTDDIEKLLILYDTHILENGRKWRKINSMMQYFDFREIESVRYPDLIKIGLTESISLETAMEVYLQPERVPKPTFDCKGSPFLNDDGEIVVHSKKCDKEIHDILIKLATVVQGVVKKEYKGEFERDFGKLVNYIINHDGRIPNDNF